MLGPVTRVMPDERGKLQHARTIPEFFFAAESHDKTD
jgi:hypothetical protein